MQSKEIITISLLLALSTLYNVKAIPLSDFYPFGTTAGDNEIPSTDDGASELITLNRVFPFYGTDHFVIVVRLFAKVAS